MASGRKAVINVATSVEHLIIFQSATVKGERCTLDEKMILPMRALELRQLRYFQILSRELHFGKAANTAHVTQSALSQQIAKLEELAGVQLFVRDPRGVRLTAAGEVLRDGVARVLDLLYTTLRSTREAGENESFRLSLGLVEYTNLPFIPPALIRLQALYPDVNIIRHELNGAQQLDALVSGVIDVGFGVRIQTNSPKAGIASQPLLASEWSLLMRDTHRLANRAQLSIEDLAGERLIVPGRSVNAPLYDSLLAHFARVGIKPNIVYETTQSQVGITLVEQGLGVLLGAVYVFTVIPTTLLYRPVNGFDPLTVELFSRSGEQNPLVLDFIELAAGEAVRLKASEVPDTIARRD